MVHFSCLITFSSLSLLSKEISKISSKYLKLHLKKICFKAGHFEYIWWICELWSIKMNSGACFRLSQEKQQQTDMEAAARGG